MRSLIDVVPFGLPNELAGRIARVGTRVMKGVRPGIRASDHVLLWAGSILDWQDPQTLVRAVASIAARRDDIKLFFMGTRHPNPQVPPMRAVEESMALARELGRARHASSSSTTGCRTPIDGGISIEADLGLSTHRDHLETRLSFRTRMLDYLWTGLPIVCTDGDVFASLVAERGLGAVVPPGDVDGPRVGNRAAHRRQRRARALPPPAARSRRGVSLAPGGRPRSRAFAMRPAARARPRVAAAGAVRAAGPELSPGEMG